MHASPLVPLVGFLCLPCTASYWLSPMYALSSRFAFCATASLGKCTPALNPPQLASAAASSLFSVPNQISHMHQVPGSRVPFLTMTILSLVFSLSC
jgi:hypothetical protein